MCLRTEAGERPAVFGTGERGALQAQCCDPERIMPWYEGRGGTAASPTRGQDVAKMAAEHTPQPRAARGKFNTSCRISRRRRRLPADSVALGHPWHSREQTGCLPAALDRMSITALPLRRPCREHPFFYALAMPRLLRGDFR
jgi:hypothetical protein